MSLVEEGNPLLSLPFYCLHIPMKYLQCSRVLNILHVTQLQPKTRGHAEHHSKDSMIFICKDLRRLDIEISVDSFSLRSIKRRVSVFSLHTHTATLRI